MPPANTLDDAYRACNPDEPLKASDNRYVDLTEVRGTRNVATTIAQRIERNTVNGQPFKQLFTGHRGSGKSTELLRLKQALEGRNFFTVYIDIEDILDLADIDYLDILLSIAKQTEADLRTRGIELNHQLMQELGNWFTDKIIEKDEKTDISGEISTQASAETGLPFFARLMANLTANIKTASSRRVTIRQNLGRELAGFIERLNTLLDNARLQVTSNHQFKDIVLIVDGLEKMHYRILEDGQSSHVHLFVIHAEQLKAPHCHIIYTTPISLAYNANLGNDFDDIQFLPMVKMNPEGKARLHDVVNERINIHSLFEQESLLTQLIELSGGVVRDLMRLIRLSTESDQPVITQKDIDYAKTTLIREYDRLLREDEFDKLMKVRQEQHVTGDETFARLLNLRLILEYQNGVRWADVHPAVMQIPWLIRRVANGNSN